jgi:hypothetical protein
MNEIQKNVFNMVKEAICDSVDHSSVRYNAIKIVTPFLDWVSEPVSIYVTEDGNITDGEKTLNQIKALRVYEKFLSWPERSDYFEDHNINPIGGSLDAQYLESPDDILRYIQGVSRLPILFDANPISDKEDRFPTKVRSDILEILMNEYPNRPSEDTFKWASKLTQPYSFSTKTGIKIHSDMHPTDRNKNIQIISNATSTDSVKRAHVASKLYNHLCWEKVNVNVQTIVVVHDILKYPEDSQNAIQAESDMVVEFKNGKSAKMQLAGEIAEAY